MEGVEAEAAQVAGAEGGDRRTWRHRIRTSEGAFGGETSPSGGRGRRRPEVPPLKGTFKKLEETGNQGTGLLSGELGTALPSDAASLGLMTQIPFCHNHQIGTPSYWDACYVCSIFLQEIQSTLQKCN